MATYLLSPDFDAERVKNIENKIRNVVPDLVRLSRMDDVAQALSGKAREKSTVLVLATPKDSSYFGKLVELASRHRDRCFFIVISDDIAASEYKRLVRTGGADWVSSAAVPQEVVDIMSRQRGGSEARAANRGEPIVVCF